MITLDILEQRLLQFPYFDACLVCLFFDHYQPDIYISDQNTMRTKQVLFFFVFNKVITSIL